MPDTVHAWFDGACEPANPGGIGTYGFVVRRGDELLATRWGEVPEIGHERMTNNVAEYFGLVMLAEWLRDNGGLPARIHGDSKIVVSQVKGEMNCNAAHLRHLRDVARATLPAGCQLVHVMRERNLEADALTHRAYIEVLRHDPELLARYEPDMATESQVFACKRLGLPTYAFMGKREASRLLARHEEARERETAATRERETAATRDRETTATSAGTAVDGEEADAVDGEEADEGAASPKTKHQRLTG